MGSEMGGGRGCDVMFPREDGKTQEERRKTGQGNRQEEIKKNIR